MKKEWLPISEAAKVLKVSERTLYTRIKSGVVKSKLEHGKRFVQVKTPHENSAANSENLAANSDNSATNPEISETFQSLLAEKDARIQQQEDQIQHLEKQSDNLTQQIDRLTQLLAVQTKTNAALTDRLQGIEDMRQRRTVWQRFRAFFVTEAGSG